MTASFAASHVPYIWPIRGSLICLDPLKYVASTLTFVSPLSLTWSMGDADWDREHLIYLVSCIVADKPTATQRIPEETPRWRCYHVST